MSPTPSEIIANLVKQALDVALTNEADVNGYRAAQMRGVISQAFNAGATYSRPPIVDRSRVKGLIEALEYIATYSPCKTSQQKALSALSTYKAKEKE